MSKKIAIHGEITELNQANMTFKLQPIHGHNKISGPVPKQCYAAFLKAFNDHKTTTRVLIEGVIDGAGNPDIKNRPLALKSVERVAILHPLDFHASLDEFRNMQDGWYEGDGKAPPHSGLDWLSHAFRRGYPADLPLPHTYPTFDGGVQCEWSLGQFYIEIEIDLNTRKADWIRFKRKTKAFEEEEILNLDDPSAWTWMAAKIRETLERAG